MAACEIIKISGHTEARGLKEANDQRREGQPTKSHSKATCTCTEADERNTDNIKPKGENKTHTAEQASKRRQKLSK